MSKPNASLIDLIQVYMVNLGSFFMTLFLNIELFLKILLLLASIIYTCYKLFKEIKNDK